MISHFWTELNWAKLIRQQGCFLKCFAQLIRLRKLKKSLLRFVPFRRCFVLCFPIVVWSLSFCMPLILPTGFLCCEQIIAAATDVQEKKEIYTPYNILPLDSAGATQSIMQFEEVKAAVGALWNTRGLNWPTEFERHRQKAGDLDILDWLRAMFGFQACGVCVQISVWAWRYDSIHFFYTCVCLFWWLQRDNVRNQREHLILLLANNHTALDPKPEPLNKAWTDLSFEVVTLLCPVISNTDGNNSISKALDWWDYFCMFCCYFLHPQDEFVRLSLLFHLK